MVPRRVIFGGFPRVLAGLGLGGHRSSLGLPGEVFLGRQGTHSGSEYELSCGRIEGHFALGSLGKLHCGQIGAHLSCVHSTEAFRVVTRAGKIRAAPGKKSLGMRAQEERVDRVEEAKRVERIEGTG